MQESELSPEVAAACLQQLHVVMDKVNYARRLHRLPKYPDCRLRKVPWPHLKAYHALVEEICTTASKTKLRDRILRTPEQVIRRLTRTVADMGIILVRGRIRVVRQVHVRPEDVVEALKFLKHHLQLDERTEPVHWIDWDALVEVLCAAGYGERCSGTESE